MSIVPKKSPTFFIHPTMVNVRLEYTNYKQKRPKLQDFFIFNVQLRQKENEIG